MLFAQINNVTTEERLGSERNVRFGLVETSRVPALASPLRSSRGRAILSVIKTPSEAKASEGSSRLVKTVFRLAAKIVTVVSEGKPSVVRTSFSMKARFVADGKAIFTRVVG